MPATAPAQDTGGARPDAATREPIAIGRLVFNAVTLAAVLIGTLAMALDLGYRQARLPRLFLRAVEWSAIVVLLLEIPIRAMVIRQAREFLRGCWPEVAIAAILLPSAGRLSPVAGAAFLVGHVALRFVRALRFCARRRIEPTRILAGSLVALILLGAFALKLPRATTDRINIADALFTSTSAVCLNGLTVRPIGNDQTPGLPESLVDEDVLPAGFTLFGQAVVLVLVQAGGVALLFFGALFALRMTNPANRLTGEPAPPIRAGRALAFVLATTLLIEAIGAALLYTMLSGFHWPVSQKLFFAAFHSVTAFCNTGFSLTGNSFVRYHGYWQVHGVIAPLIVLGGLGAPVLMNLGECLRTRLFGTPAGRPRPGLTLHTRLVLWTSAILILVGVTGLMLTEGVLAERLAPGTHVGSHTPTTAYAERLSQLASQPDPHRLRDESTPMQLADAWFMSVSARSGGFHAIDMNYRGQAVNDGSLIVMMLLMLAGGSPGSAGGGLKTVTVAVLALAVVSSLRRRDPAVMGRSLPSELIRRAGAVAGSYLALVVLVTFALALTEGGRSTVNAPFMQVLFEAVSGCANAGLSAGLTADLTLGGRIVMVLAMLLGRLIPLVALAGMMTPHQASDDLPTEPLALG